MRQVFHFSSRIFEIKYDEYLKLRKLKDSSFYPIDTRNLYLVNCENLSFIAVDNTSGKFLECTFGTLKEAIIYLLHVDHKIVSYREKVNG